MKPTKSQTLTALIACTLWSAAARAAPETFRCQAKGGAAWTEYRSAHFLLDGDLSRERAALLLQRLEDLHALELQALVGEQVDIPGRLRVLAFSSDSQFTTLAGHRDIAGYYVVGSLGEPTIVLPLRGFEAQPETVAHELAHHLSRFLFPRQKLWYAEGLAMFVQTVAGQGEGNAAAVGSHIVHGEGSGRGRVGAVPRYLGWALRDSRSVPAKELLAWNGHFDSTDSLRFHGWSWLLYHYLWNQRSKQFTDYQQRLGNGESPEAAWRAALPDLDPSKPEAMARLDEELQRYGRSARYVSYRVEVKGDARFTEAPLAPADVHMLLAGARRSWPKGEEEASRRAEADEALSEDPLQPLALALRAGLSKTSARDPLRQATAQRPADFRAWLLLGMSLDDKNEKAEKLAALRKAAALNPDNAWTQNNLAWALLGDEPREALRLANRAVDLAPWSPGAIDTLAHAAALLGKCKEALQLEARSLDAIAGAPGGDAEAQKRLADMAQRCKPPPAK